MDNQFADLEVETLDTEDHQRNIEAVATLA